MFESEYLLQVHTRLYITKASGLLHGQRYFYSQFIFLELIHIVLKHLQNETVPVKMNTQLAHACQKSLTIIFWEYNMCCAHISFTKDKQSLMYIMNP